MGYKPYSADPIKQFGNFFSNLQQNAAVQKLKFLNASSGHKFAKKKKKYENLKWKVQNLMQIYIDETDIHFFRAIASFFRAIASQFKFDVHLNIFRLAPSLRPHGVTSRPHIVTH